MTGHDDTNREVVHATICAPAAEMLRAFCIGHGVTVTAFLDGLGHVLADLQNETIDQMAQSYPAAAAALLHARTIDAGRRNRKRRQHPTLPSSDEEPAKEADLPA